ncbi:proteasome, subunit beta 4 [Trichoderma longibrachiatum ATCC 18648]|uniref:Proteasome subunit beta n=1 Tax=Trichoderma longibrachiatum ATCC 18648 TaxID=983965 RepID=A0A2T4C9B3_TRILO|nr:proteasome, subunit beta 4 [Trichoderma longibrachiatum ATCC 18648]
MDHRPQAWGRPRDDVYGAYDRSYMQDNGPKQNTQQPIVTGTSVVAIKFKDGVVMAADNLASYGSLARFTDVKRLRPFAGTSVVGFSGDISDMQYLDRHLIDLSLSEAYESPDKPPYSAPSLATGFGAMLAQPIMRRYVPDEESAKKLSRDEAVNIVKEAMKVLFYRDARSLDSYSLAVVTKDGVELKENEKLEDQSWAFADRIKGYGTQTV